MKNLSWLILIVSCLLVAPAFGDYVGLSNAGDISATVNQAQPAMAQPPMAVAPTPAPAAVAVAAATPSGPQPFGKNLFTGGFASERELGLNPEYIISQGDQITLRIWGAIEDNEQLIVDPQGNIFIPKVGPVHVAGLSNAQLNQCVSQAIGSVFTNNVQVYTTLNSAQPVAIFVTGFVNNPGRFAGVASNSILYFIDRAAGIDPVRGSYRNIRLLRGGQEIAHADLYEFLLHGELPAMQLKDGDTIVVGPRGNTVSVTGDVRNAYMFEMTGPSISGTELMGWARPLATASHAQWRGIRGATPRAEYATLAQLAAFTLQDGDVVNISSDYRSNNIVVYVEGSFEGPSQYVLPRDYVLSDLLDMIPVDKTLANFGAVSIRRRSIAEQQKQTLQDSLRRLESSYLLASSATADEAQIRVEESKMVSDFVRRVAQVEPNGRLVLGNASTDKLILEDGDVITIPQNSRTVLVTGEVLAPQALIYQDKMSAIDYVRKSGGFSDQADPDRILLVHQSGSVDNDSSATVQPGDQVMVFPKVPSKNMQFAIDIVDVLYKVAVSAGVLVRVR